MISGIALLPCPLCATPPKGPTRMSGPVGPDWMIVCPACGLKLERYAVTRAPDDPARAQIIEAWNLRAGEIAGIPDIEALPAQAAAQSDSLI